MTVALLRSIVTLYPANGTLYCASFDSGTTTDGDVTGSVFEINPESGAPTRLGATFPVTHLPYSLCWAKGRLWCGTVVNTLATASAGKVYWIRPGIDTAWTLDNTFATSEAGVTGLAVFQGLLYASLLFDGTGTGTGKVMVRSTAGVWSNSDTGAIGVDGTGVARGYYSLLTWPPEQNVMRTPTPCLFAVRGGITAESGYVIRSFNGTAWSTVYSAGAGGPDLVHAYASDGTHVVPVLWTANGDTSVLNSVDGVTFTERFSNLTIAAGPLIGLAVQR